MTDRVLDWRPRFDPRSLNFRVQALNADLPVRNWTWKRNLWLNQGNTPGCTGWSITHDLGTTPHRMTGLDNAFAMHRYERARQEDEWPGENYDGSSVLGAMEACRKDGLLVSYHWSKTLNEILYAVSHIGPVDIGVNWYTNMMETDVNGFIHPTGTNEGGHSLLIGAVHLDKNAVELYNSWGKDWGVKGNALLAIDDLDKLRQEQGEFAVAKKLRS